MQRLPFDKYQGLGNDFIVVRWEDPETFGVERARELCDRHFGVGADGVLLVSPAQSATARARMTVLNADGSRPEMCGNGLRCVALALAQDDSAKTPAREARSPQIAEFVVDTDAGPRHCRVDLEAGPLPSAQVTTNMGRAELQGELAIEQSGQEYCFARVSMGNPHAIRFGAPESTARVDELGPLVSGKVAGGLNVEFARVLGERDVEVVVWERGVGRTLACGTGAAATAVAAALAGHVPFDAPVTVRLPGGPLEISVARETLEVQLRGPARWVFSGEWGSTGEWAR